ncbi:MAG: hypothetical protein VCB43_13590 [Myxococcota bacterium]
MSENATRISPRVAKRYFAIGVERDGGEWHFHKNALAGSNGEEYVAP